jgi:hypothetical protein
MPTFALDMKAKRSSLTVGLSIVPGKRREIVRPFKAFRLERAGDTLTAFDGTRRLWSARLLTSDEMANWLLERAMDDVATHAMRRAGARPPLRALESDARQALCREVG